MHSALVLCCSHSWPLAPPGRSNKGPKSLPPRSSPRGGPRAPLKAPQRRPRRPQEAPREGRLAQSWSRPARSAWRMLALTGSPPRGPGGALVEELFGGDGAMMHHTLMFRPPDPTRPMTRDLSSLVIAIVVAIVVGVVRRHCRCRRSTTHRGCFGLGTPRHSEGPARGAVGRRPEQWMMPCQRRYPWRTSRDSTRSGCPWDQFGKLCA